MTKCVVFESFEFESFDKTIWYLSKGDKISYEFYTDTFDLHYSEPVAFEENNAIRIYVYDEAGNPAYFSGPAIDIKKYVNEIYPKSTDYYPQMKSTDYYPKKEEPESKHLKVLQFDNLNIMNKTLNKYDEKDIVSITPIKVTTNTGIGHASEDTIIYCVTVRE